MKIKFYFILTIFLVFISCKKESNDAYTSDAKMKYKPYTMKIMLLLLKPTQTEPIVQI
jgi:hypothetical protein